MIMKCLLLGINAKYIHVNLAIRLLKANTNYPVDIKEYTTKENNDVIIKHIIDNDYEMVGFSCYIWNIEYIKELLIKLKEINPKIIIFLGGPEVSYNAKNYLDICDYVIKNEGEEAFNKLLMYYDNLITLDEIPNLYYKDSYTFDKLVDMKTLKYAYDLIEDVENRVIYFETSRGCPYKCSYCMASLDNKVRFFEISTILEELQKLLDRGAKTIKFLDRTFNANKKNFVKLVDFLQANHKPYNSFQFEITGDLLDSDVIDYINNLATKNLFRFEIGIQSTNKNTNLLVNRIQNNEKLFKNIRLIQDANKIDLHLDLIAGLPKEDYSSFQNTFNEVFDLHPKELQLGFLKLLHGTKLLTDHKLYDYTYSKTAPYEILSNDSLDNNDIYKIHMCEEGLEKFYNSGYLNSTFKLLFNYIKDFFSFFKDLGYLYTSNNKLDLASKYKLFDDYIKNNHSDIYDIIHISIIKDYLKYHTIKPKLWWDNLDKAKRNEILHSLKDNLLSNYNNDVLFKYSCVILYKKTIIVAIYKDFNLTIHEKEL